MAALTAAERNRRKRERKKKSNETVADAAAAAAEDPPSAAQAPERPQGPVANEHQREPVNVDDIEIEYVADELPIVPEGNGADDLNEAMEAVRRFQARVSVAVVSSDEGDGGKSSRHAEDDDNEHDLDDGEEWSKRKLRDTIRPTVADLKLRVNRPDLVEAHDVTAADPEFLIRLKSVPGTVPVPRHWGRKRKYLQGKRGFEKQPFQLPDFLVNTGITELRDTVMKAESSMSAKQKNRSRVQVKLGAIDVDYRTLYDAFFKHQTKPTGLTHFGDLYYEGKELEVGRKIQVGQPLSAALQAALGMTHGASSPPPWLINMQRYGPPPSYPSLKIPGLNAPLPDPSCQYGYHPNGWGKPPIDMYGRPLYGGNPFDPPGGSGGSNMAGDDSLYGGGGSLVTSDGKTIVKSNWGALPTGDGARREEDDEEESSDEEMDESSEEEEQGEDAEDGLEEDGMESTMPPPMFASSTAPVDLRKTGLETPMSIVGGPPKQLYTVLEQKQAATADHAVFASEIAYSVPTTQHAAAAAAAETESGAESVLSKALPAKATNKRVNKDDDDDEDDDELRKKFKF